MQTSFTRDLRRPICLAVALFMAVLGGALAGSPRAQAQQADEADRQFEEAMAETEQQDQQREAAAAESAEDDKLNLWRLYRSGGILMYPITLMSLIAVAFGVERALALRRSRIMPADLVDQLSKLSASSSGIDPRKAYRLCQKHPSSLSTIIRAMLLKVGRPHSEVEHTVTEASDREATRLYSNVRPIALVVTVTPLLGLLGTVQGMIIAFANTATTVVGVNKATQLAEGIYTALVTTFAGLSVAIPAAILAHYFEGRIMSLFRDVDELVQSLLPQLERYEGKLRVNSKQLGGEVEPPPVSAATPAVAPAAVATGVRVPSAAQQ